MRVLVTGGSGLLGSVLVEMLAQNGHSVIATYNAHEPRQIQGVKWVKIDISRGYLLEDLAWKEKPHAIIHSAAMTDVDKCEIEKEKAWKTNVEATRSAVRAARAVNAHIIYISTDYVFDGEKGNYTEEDLPAPVNYYGLTKLVAEEIVRTSDVLYTIIRPSAIYGLGGSKKSFAEYVADKLTRGEEVPALVDQYVSPTYNRYLASAILKILDMRPLGTIHVAGQRTNRYEFALTIADILGAPKNLVKPAKTQDMKNWLARRPRDSSLDTSEANRLLGYTHENNKALQDFVKEYLEKRRT
jgi:dTDP-4-dehydrorhamnose reductase